MPSMIGRVPTFVRAIAATAVLLVSAGCATAPGRTTNADPLEGMNRGIHTVNETLDRAALKPVAKGYRKITPRWFRIGVGNFFANLSYPTTIVNQFLQGKPGMGLRDTGRFVLNSTFGVGGLFDVATPTGLPANDEDFGQTLATWGVGSGAYLELPLFGPSTLRDAPSKAFDYFLNPLQYTDVPWETEWGLRVVNVVNTRSELLSVDDSIENAFDPYAFLRDAWVQRREFQIYDGNPPPETLEEEFIEDDAATAEAEPTP